MPRAFQVRVNPLVWKHSCGSNIQLNLKSQPGEARHGVYSLQDKGSCIRYFMMFDICLTELGLPQPQVVTPANIPTMSKWVSAKQQMWPQPQCRIYRSRLLGWRCDAMHCVRCIVLRCAKANLIAEAQKSAANLGSSVLGLL